MPPPAVVAIDEAIDRYGVPAIFNTDQGSRFTSDAFIRVLEYHHTEISMDGKGRALDNVERLWRSLKYEDIYLNSYETLAELQQGVDYATPEKMHQSFVLEEPLPLTG